MAIIVSKTVRTINHEATGKRARKMRESAKLTLREMAVKMGISAPYLSDLERGRRDWSERLAQSFTSNLKA